MKYGKAKVGINRREQGKQDPERFSNTGIPGGKVNQSYFRNNG